MYIYIDLFEDCVEVVENTNIEFLFCVCGTFHDALIPGVDIILPFLVAVLQHGDGDTFHVGSFNSSCDLVAILVKSVAIVTGKLSQPLGNVAAQHQPRITLRCMEIMQRLHDGINLDGG